MCQIHYLVSPKKALNFLIITPCACARGKVIGRVVIVVVVVVTKIAISRCLGTYATRKHNESVAFGKKQASNRGSWSTSVTNSAFLLAFITTPIDSAHSMHAGLVFSAHAHNKINVMNW